MYISMAGPIIYFNTFINELKNKNPQITREELKVELYKLSIMTKYYEEDNLIIVYHRFDIPTTTKLQQVCRSLVIDGTTFEIVSFSCVNPICNREAQQLLIKNNSSDITFYRCYEGSLMSLFYYNNKWYLSTRRCLHSTDSVWNNITHQQMFIDVLATEGLKFDEFCDKLDKTKCYNFILLHHNLQNIVKYEKIFGENYMKLCLAFVRDNTTHEICNNYTIPEFKNIFISEPITIEEFSDENKQIKLDVISEGITTNLKVGDETYLLKLQNLSYQFSKAIGSESNIYKGYIYLYQVGILKEYLTNYSTHANYGTITNPYNQDEKFDTIGVVDAVFKVLTSELFELFKTLWNLKTNQHLNAELYQLLPKEYKDVLFGLRGIYYQLRIKNMSEQTKLMFGIKDIYSYLKTMDVDQICALLRQRKLMFNWIVIGSNQNQELKNFRKISDKCDVVHLKLISIYINKLFPEILSSDIPTQTATTNI